jgi:hypothetical protein
MSTEAEGCLNKNSGVMISIIDHGKTLECYRENIYKNCTYIRSSTRRGNTPDSITAWILSLVPSDRYERAQQASVKTSSS